jgi:hypothetical protein
MNTNPEHSLKTGLLLKKSDGICPGNYREVISDIVGIEYI